MLNALIAFLRQLLFKKNEIEVYRKIDDYDSVIDDMPLTIVRSET